jgi:hypothetical protein
MTMRIGTQTNSLVNHLYSRAVNGQPEPVIGMGATLLHSPNPNGHRQHFRRRTDGTWKGTRQNHRNGAGLLLGRRDRYFDPSF